MRSHLFQRFQLLFDTPGDPGTGGGPAAGAPGGTPTPAPASGTPNAAPPAGGGNGSPGSGNPGTRFEYQENRGDWVPPYRLNQTAQERDAARRENEILQNRLRVMAGLEPAADPRSEQVKNSFLELFPQFKGLLENEDALKEVLEFTKSGGLKQVGTLRDQYYGTRAAQTAREATAAWGKTMGYPEGQPLPQGLEDVIATNLNLFISQDESRYNRFQYGDTTVVTDFVKWMKGMFADPIRSNQNLDAARRVEANNGLPKPGPAGAPPNSAEPKTKLRGAALRSAAREYMLGNRTAQ